MATTLGRTLINTGATASTTPPAAPTVISNVPSAKLISLAMSLATALAVLRTRPMVPITISHVMSSISHNEKFTPLGLAQENWPTWKAKVLEVMVILDLEGYMLETTTVLDHVQDVDSFVNWVRNHKKICGFLRSLMENGEKQYMEDIFASDVWNVLKLCYEQQGPITQVCMIQDPLSILYPVNFATCPAISNKICDLIDQIFTQSIPTRDVLLLVAMLGTLECIHDSLHSGMSEEEKHYNNPKPEMSGQPET